jgi:hypothetical protein
VTTDGFWIGNLICWTFLLKCVIRFNFTIINTHKYIQHSVYNQVFTVVLFLGVGWDWFHMVRQPLFDLLYQPRMVNDDERGAVGGLIGRGNRSTRREPTSLPLWPPQILRDVIWTRTWPALVESLRLKACNMVRPLQCRCLVLASTAHILLPLGSGNVRWFSYHLLEATAHND